MAETTEQPKKNNLSFEIDLQKLRKNGIFLMVPCYGGQCFAAFAKSLMELSMLCIQHGVPLKTHFLYNESLVTRARNYCADEFLRAQFETVDENGEKETRYFQHGIFVDADIEFSAQDVLVLAHLQNTEEEYDVIGGVYPKKCIAWEKIKKAVDKGVADEDYNVLENFIGDYVFNPAKSGSISLSKPAEVLETGTGFMMFRRDTLLKFKEAYPDYSYKPDHVRTKNFDGSREIHAFFETIIDPETKRYLSEDYFFCQYARKAGMKVWICPWMQLKHHGYYSFGGSLSALASIGETPTANAKTVRKR